MNLQKRIISATCNYDLNKLIEESVPSNLSEISEHAEKSKFNLRRLSAGTWRVPLKGAPTKQHIAAPVKVLDPPLCPAQWAQTPFCSLLGQRWVSVP